MTLSVVILTKNEERNIAKCMESVLFADEIIIIDDYSIDSTLKIAKDLGAKVYSRDLNNNWGEQRNYGTTKAEGKWVLFIDADEVVSNKLKNEIIQLTGDPLNPVSGYFIKRRDILWGKIMKRGEVGNKKLLRLAKKNKGTWKRSVHEYWKVAGKIKYLKGELIHTPHQSVMEFISHIDNYSSIHAQENMKDGKKSNLLKILLFPPLKFTLNYIIKLGFLDGTQGFLVAAIMSLHSYLSWSKLWLVQKRNIYKTTN